MTNFQAEILRLNETAAASPDAKSLLYETLRLLDDSKKSHPRQIIADLLSLTLLNLSRVSPTLSAVSLLSRTFEISDCPE